MKKIIEFLDQIHKTKDLVFSQKIKQFEQEHQGENHFNGEKLSIEGQRDFFLYLSKDKKEFSTSWDDYNPKIEYSFLIYFVFYLHKAVYTNGGLEFIGFYDKDYKKIDKIPLKGFNIVDTGTGCNFDNIKRPIFTLEIQNSSGNKHTTIRGDSTRLYTCQKVIDFIWEIENYYSELFGRLVESPDY
jgi:hypothetical protein